MIHADSKKPAPPLNTPLVLIRPHPSAERAAAGIVQLCKFIGSTNTEIYDADMTQYAPGGLERDVDEILRQPAQPAIGDRS